MVNRLLKEYQKITEGIHFLGFESYMVYFDKIKDWDSYRHDHPDWFRNWDKFLFEKNLSEIASFFEKKDVFQCRLNNILFFCMQKYKLLEKNLTIPIMLNCIEVIIQRVFKANLLGHGITLL